MRQQYNQQKIIFIMYFYFSFYYFNYFIFISVVNLINISSKQVLNGLQPWTLTFSSPPQAAHSRSVLFTKYRRTLIIINASILLINTNAYQITWSVIFLLVVLTERQYKSKLFNLFNTRSMLLSILNIDQYY